MNEKWLKILGLVIAAVGFGLNQVAGWISEKQLDQQLDKKIAEALRDKN
jgi:hypothetical protein